MTKQQLEAWVHEIIDRVLAGQPIEDSRVELKREWIEPAKAARRLAGHANASRGDAALWIVGIDENACVITGAQQQDLASWHSQVQSCFDDQTPELIASIAVARSGVTVVAMLYATDRAPYVVRNSAGGHIQREVPWRIGTRVDSITREQLLRLLVPLTRRPTIEATIVEVIASVSGNQVDVNVIQSFLLEQPAGQVTTIPMHKCGLEVKAYGFECGGVCVDHSFKDTEQRQIRCSEDMLIATGSTYFQTHYYNHAAVNFEQLSSCANRPVFVSTTFGLSEISDTVRVEATAEFKRFKNNRSMRWKSSKWKLHRESEDDSEGDLFMTG